LKIFLAIAITILAPKDSNLQCSILSEAFLTVLLFNMLSS